MAARRQKGESRLQARSAGYQFGNELKNSARYSPLVARRKHCRSRVRVSGASIGRVHEGSGSPVRWVDACRLCLYLSLSLSLSLVSPSELAERGESDALVRVRILLPRRVPCEDTLCHSRPLQCSTLLARTKGERHASLLDRCFTFPPTT